MNLPIGDVILERLVEPRFLIAYGILIGFFVAYGFNPSDTMNGALIAAFAGAWGYYLGSSNSSQEIRKQMGQTLDIAHQALPPAPHPDIELKPGETATVGAEPGGGAKKADATEILE